MNDLRFCVCVPARNEAERLPILLDALAAQTVAGCVPVALCVNNSDDGSAAIAAGVAARYPGRLDVKIDECVLAPEIAHAGTARGRAMDAGHALIAGRGVLISTDADCRPPAGWIAGNLAAIMAGANVVGGRIELDEDEPTASPVLAMRARFDRYWAAVRAIEDAIDPAPHDPPPRHGDHTGASLAIDAALFHAAGGVPAIPSGEDRALVIAAVAIGGKLVHPTGVWTRASARTVGRAEQGMAMAMDDLAATIARGVEPRVPSFDHWRRRAEWRRDERMTTGASAMLAREETLPPMPADMPLPAFAG